MALAVFPMRYCVQKESKLRPACRDMGSCTNHFIPGENQGPLIAAQVLPGARGSTHSALLPQKMQPHHKHHGDNGGSTQEDSSTSIFPLCFMATALRVPGLQQR